MAAVKTTNAVSTIPTMVINSTNGLRAPLRSIKALTTSLSAEAGVSSSQENEVITGQTARAVIGFGSRLNAALPMGRTIMLSSGVSASGK